MKKLFVMALVSLFAATSAQAMVGSYVKGALGYSFGGEIEADPGSSADLESGVFLYGAYGIRFSPMYSTEIELSYRTNDVEDSSVEVSALNLAVNAVMNIPMGSIIEPYFGGGLTLGNYGVEAPGLDESAFGVGLQFFAGASFMVQEGISIGSGDVESLVKQISARTKLTGAAWKVSHIPQVLAHRCAYLNDELTAEKLFLSRK